jgi:indolepyruvate ferredoxin oxidoreductase beta subunit
LVKEYNVVIASVGGQGGVTLTRVIGYAALSIGENVRIGETLGMAQRGGSVQSHIRVGSDVYGPMISKGAADALIALEPSEALRVADYLSRRTLVILNTEPIYPIPVILGEEKYPAITDITQSLSTLGCKVYLIDTKTLAEEAKAQPAQNIVALGALIAIDDSVLTIKSVRSALSESLNKRFLEMNLRALQAGYNHASLFSPART